MKSVGKSYLLVKLDEVVAEGPDGSLCQNWVELFESRWNDLASVLRKQEYHVERSPQGLTLVIDPVVPVVARTHFGSHVAIYDGQGRLATFGDPKLERILGQYKIK